MGCLFSYPLSWFQSLTGGNADDQKKEDEPKVYSWDVRKKVDPKDFTIENKSGEVIVRLPGTINGMQFIIQNLENCTVYLLDHVAQISIDDCKNCKFIIGPSKASVFIRDCSDCNFGLICQQYRTRDCRKITTFMLCATQPIIESSTYMKFGCISINYNGLKEQLELANITPFNNHWHHIHDFTPVPGESNYSFHNPGANLEDYLGVVDENLKTQMNLSFQKPTSVIPFTIGTTQRPNTELCLVVVFVADPSKEASARQDANAKNLITNVLSSSQLVLVQTRKFRLSEVSAENVFGSKNYTNHLLKGEVVGVEFAGANAIQICQSLVQSLKIEPAFVSQPSANVKQQLDNFYNFAEMQMSV